MNDVEKYIATIEAHGGPAFPAKYKLPSDGEYQSPGMTLRDWFAGQALAGLMGNSGGPIQANGMTGWGYVNCGPETIASEAYKVADAMLQERNK